MELDKAPFLLTDEGPKLLFYCRCLSGKAPNKVLFLLVVLKVPVICCMLSFKRQKSSSALLITNTSLKTN